MRNIDRLLEGLKESPKSFSDLKQLTDVGNGVIQHHLRNSDKLKREKHALMVDGYCKTCALQELCRNQCIETVLDDSSKRRILELFSQGLSQREIASEVGLSASTVNHHLSRMRKFNIIQDEYVRPEVMEKLQT